MSVEISTVRLAELDAHSYKQWLNNGARCVIIPVGALEQHGPHLPMGTDALLSELVAVGTAERMGGKVAQPFTYGYKSQQKSGGGNHLVGTTSLRGNTLVQQVRDVVAAFLAQGVAHVVLLNGHYENYQFLYEGVDLALGDLGLTSATGGQCVLLLSYWDYVGQASLEAVYGGRFPGWDVEHGGVLETSLLLHLRPDLVRLDRAMDHPPAQLPRFDRLPVVPDRTPISGCLSAPAGSSAEHGRLLFEQVVNDLANELARELGPA